MTSNKMAESKGPLISLETTAKPDTMSIVWMSLNSAANPVEGYRIYLNGTMCGNMVKHRNNGNNYGVGGGVGGGGVHGGVGGGVGGGDDSSDFEVFIQGIYIAPLQEIKTFCL